MRRVRGRGCSPSVNSSNEPAHMHMHAPVRVVALHSLGSCCIYESMKCMLLATGGYLKATCFIVINVNRELFSDSALAGLVILEAICRKFSR